MMSNLSIRTQITTSIVIFSVLSLLTISVISVVNLSIVSDNTRDLATESMEDQIMRNIQLSSNETASVISQKLISAQAVIRALVTSTEEAFKEDSPLGYRKSYFDQQLPPDTEYDDRFKKVVSMNYSTYYLPQSTNATIESMKTDAINETINRSAHMDYYFRPLMESYPEFIKLYMGFEEGHMFRGYPGDTRLNRDYDPTIRPWYIDAINAPRGDTVFTKPYPDASLRGWMISVTEAVYVDDELIGVIAGDLLITTIQEKVLDVSFLESGYAALIEDDGLVVAHPDWSLESDDPVYLKDVEGDSITESLLTEITSSKEGVVTYVRDGETQYLAHVPFLEKYIFLISVPRDEAIVVVKQIDSNIDSAESSVKSTTLVLSFLTFVVVLGIGLWLGNTIASPIEDLSTIATQLSQNATKSNILDGIKLDLDLRRDDEIGELTRSFSKMVDSLSGEQKIEMEFK